MGSFIKHIVLLKKKKKSIKYHQLSWAALFFMVTLQRVILIRTRNSLNKPDSSVVKPRILTPLLSFQNSLKILGSVVSWFLKPRLMYLFSFISFSLGGSRSRTAL